MKADSTTTGSSGPTFRTSHCAACSVVVVRAFDTFQLMLFPAGGARRTKASSGRENRLTEGSRFEMVPDSRTMPAARLRAIMGAIGSR
jgi:hypothetical protein